MLSGIRRFTALYIMIGGVDPSGRIIAEAKATSF
jgi:hypothetical protein